LNNVRPVNRDQANLAINPVGHAVDVQNVTKVFAGHKTDKFTALSSVSVAIRQNEFFTLLGPSGCGKTTLLRLIAGFEYPTTGHIFLNGADIGGLPPFKRPVNTVFQSYALFPHLTVAENVAFGMEMLRWPKSEIAARVTEMLRLVRMEELGNRRTSQISGGQQQRVALARALAPKPQVLLLDEPLSALDAKLRKEMQIELKRMQAETGITFIFVTHDQEEALTMSDRIAVMNKGEILQVGAPQDIYGAPRNRFVAQFIGESNFLTAKVTKAGNSGVDLALAAGGTLNAAAASGVVAGDEVSVLVRPENVTLGTPVKGGLSGTVANTVYFGTDTHVHLVLDDGSSFIVRQQNAMGRTETAAKGQRLGIRIAAGSARILGE
jgi:spermidine/putrescine transport system ATP-binding protein